MGPFTIATLPSLHIGHFRKSPNLVLPIRCSTAAPSPSLASIRSKAVHFDLKAYWTSLMVQINQKLDEAIPIKFPQQIYEAMRYSSLAKGAKRAPPVMCISACELFGGSRIAAFPTACALEMVIFFLYSFYLSCDWSIIATMVELLEFYFYLSSKSVPSFLFPFFNLLE